MEIRFNLIVDLWHSVFKWTLGIVVFCLLVHWIVLPKDKSFEEDEESEKIEEKQ